MNPFLSSSSETRGAVSRDGTKKITGKFGTREILQVRVGQLQLVSSRRSRFCPWFFGPVPTNCPRVSEDELSSTVSPCSLNETDWIKLVLLVCYLESLLLLLQVGWARKRIVTDLTLSAADRLLLSWGIRIISEFLHVTFGEVIGKYSARLLVKSTRKFFRGSPSPSRKKKKFLQRGCERISNLEVVWGTNMPDITRKPTEAAFTRTWFLRWPTRDMLQIEKLLQLKKPCCKYNKVAAN